MIIITPLRVAHIIQTQHIQWLGLTRIGDLDRVEAGMISAHVVRLTDPLEPWLADSLIANLLDDWLEDKPYYNVQKFIDICTEVKTI